MVGMTKHRSLAAFFRVFISAGNPARWRFAALKLMRHFFYLD
jgi:hypothetical protein